MSGKPDVLAPAMFPVRWPVPQLSVGTSWATAVVTGVAAEIVAGARDHEEEPSPQLLRHGFRTATNRLDDGSETMLDAKGALLYVYEQLSLSRPSFGNRSTFLSDHGYDVGDEN